MTPPPHDDDRCARIYAGCKVTSVRYARRLLAGSGDRNRHLRAFDAEEFYDLAWETYYSRREYLEGGASAAEHVPRLNALILTRVRDEQRRSLAGKRRPLGEEVELTEVGAGGQTMLEDAVVERAELQRRLARVRNPEDAQALVDHEVHGLTFEEIGQLYGITAEAARRRAQRAKEQARHDPAG